jgi:large repetitive protein
MATSNLSSGITVSIANTPQATDDTFTNASTGLTEDNLQTANFDVMADNRGGKSKTLY